MVFYKGAYNEYTIHAETHCLLQMFKYIFKQQKNLNKFCIFVIRIKRDTGEFLNSKPCKECIIRMIECGIRKIYYSDENGNIIMEKLKFITNKSSSGNVSLKRN